MLAVLLLMLASPGPGQDKGVVAWVIDGDTFRLASGERIRISGIDTPESRAANAKCSAEVRRGKAATRSVVALLKGRTVRLERVGRSYDRTVARIWLDDRDLGSLLVTRRIARWWQRGRPKPDWCRG